MDVNAALAALREAERILNDRLVDDIHKLELEFGVECNFEDVPDLDEARGLVIEAIEALGGQV